MEKLLGCLTTVALGIALWLVFSLIFAGIAAWLWNMLMPALFGLPLTNYWQMFGLMILLRILLPSGVASGSKK